MERIVAHFPFAVAGFAVLLAVAGIARKRRSVATWFFFFGLLALALDSVFIGWSSSGALSAAETVRLLTLGFVVKSVGPVLWIGFSLTYSRGNRLELLRRWRVPLVVVAILPIAIILVFRRELVELVPAPSPAHGWWLVFDDVARALNIIVLGSLVVALKNLEGTFRAAVGTMRWRVKYVILGIAMILGTQIFVRSQAILYSTQDMAMASVESAGLLIGCLLFGLAYIRTGWTEIDIYPSREVLRSSITMLVVGGYLLIVGVLAQIPRIAGSADAFRLQSFIILAGMAGLGMLLLSDRFRQRVQAFVVRHFRREQHDAARIWTLLSQRLAAVRDEEEACTVSARLVSETFDVLSVRLWLLDEERNTLSLRASTAHGVDGLDSLTFREEVSGTPAFPVGNRRAAFDIERAEGDWLVELRRLNPSTFPSGGARLAVPLCASERTLGVMVLTDRVNGERYTAEELQLLASIGGQLTSVLLNLRLGQELARSRELEAFRTMSTFFVHDLKNAAASLTLMLENAAIHFDDPAFRRDALRGIGNAARQIDGTVARLSALRLQPDSVRGTANLNELVIEALDGFDHVPAIEITRELTPVPEILADRHQVQSVVANLVQNARQALPSGGRIEVRTERRGDYAILSVTDNGCGMSQTFIKNSLFRPFQSTKKQGLGIGLFQSRAIVHANGGRMHVESEVGKGTTFVATFPVSNLR